MAAENARIPIGGTVAIFAQGPVGLSAPREPDAANQAGGWSVGASISIPE